MILNNITTMKKALNLLLAGLCVFFFAACEQPQPDDDPTDEDTEQTEENEEEEDSDKPQEFEFPFVADFPIECGNLLAEGSEVGVTIEVTRVEDQNFVFELRPGALVQSFKMDVYPLAQLYNNLLNDKTFGTLTSSDSWDINERIRSYLFNESGSGGYGFSINDYEDFEDFIQLEFDWMNTPYAAASAIAIPDCGYVIAVVASVETEISSATQEDLTLCYVHTTSQPLVGDPQCEIEVNAGYTAFGVQHHLNADAAGVYFFGYLTSEIDAYVDAFGDTMFRDFMRTRVTSPSIPNDPNNPESLYYSVNYGEEADPTIMSTTCAVAVDANLTPQEGYSRSDFHLKEIPEDQPVPKTGFRIPKDRIGAHYAEFYVDFDKDAKTVYYLFYNQEQVAEYNAMTDKEKRQLMRNIANTDGYGENNPGFLWDAEKEEAVGTGGTKYIEGVLQCLAFQPGETYQVIYTSRNGFGTLTPLELSEPFTMDELNLASPDQFKAEIDFYLDNPTRTSFRSNIIFDPAEVSALRIQYMTPDFNPGFWTDASWEQWTDYIYHPQNYYDESNPYAPVINLWPTQANGQDLFTWTGMEPDTDYTIYLCAEDFDGNVSQIYFQTIRTAEVQVGPDPTVKMELMAANREPYDWTVTYTIDHDVEYYLYCMTKSADDLKTKIPGITQADINNIAGSKISYEDWKNGIYEWVAGGFENDGGGMRTLGNTSQDWEGNDTVIAACIAVGRDESGNPVHKLYHLICKDGKAQTLEQIFGVN